ncbi:hypothetical protein [Rhodopila sp.]|uniref:hypothetical protein n=1 Tax=Rhodopila sp. TaxID=2480087 RepID=UPI003D1191E7
MTYRIIITKTSPFSPDECVTEAVHCATKKELDEKYSALNHRRGRDILSIRVEHSDDRKVENL